MKKLFKNKQGFTLIELLVVIGILAVLAAIAIPSVAGLIDRANNSADNSNAVEMTNAVERFVSEYELYKQDIASGTFDKTDLDSAQGRVYNVTGIETRKQVTKFESTGLSGKGVDLDSKYPANEETFKAVVQNYMKTSSSTFEPKQSDCQYWYSPECGRVIVAEVGSKSSELTAIGFDDASINTGLDTTEQYDEIHWICLDAETVNCIANEQGELEEWIPSVKQPVIKQVEIWDVNDVLHTLNFEEGMTWNEWFTSEYNTLNLERFMDGQLLAYECDVVYESDINRIRYNQFTEENHYVHDAEYYYESIYILGGGGNVFSYDYFIYIKNDGTTEKLPVSEYENIKNN